MLYDVRGVVIGALLESPQARWEEIDGERRERERGREKERGGRSEISLGGSHSNHVRCCCGVGTGLWHNKQKLDLASGIRKGVGFHHAGLSFDDRTTVETLFQAGDLTIITCTSTLAVGGQCLSACPGLLLVRVICCRAFWSARPVRPTGLLGNLWQLAFVWRGTRGRTGSATFQHIIPPLPMWLPTLKPTQPAKLNPT